MLLQNSKGSRPLFPIGIKTLLVIGPNDNVTKIMIEKYEGIQRLVQSQFHYIS